MKKILGILLSLLASTQAGAISMYTPFQGIYVGAAAAENLYAFESQYQFNSPLVPSNVEQQSWFNKSNLNPAITIGYGGLMYDDYFGAVETNASFNEIQRTQGNVASTTNKYIFNNTYNLLAKLGWVFQDINLGYVVAGMSRTTLEREISFSDSLPIAIPPLNQTQNLYGPVFGVGYERAYDQYLHFAVEYNYINYSRNNYTLPNGGVNKVYLSQNTFLLKAVYFL